jgi:trehalose/maltose transport system substrate-binding protein
LKCKRLSIPTGCRRALSADSETAIAECRHQHGPQQATSGRNFVPKSVLTSYSFRASSRINTGNGKLVAVPFFTDAGLLYYRTDLLNKYGLKLPNTWRELTQTAKIIQDGERNAGAKDFYGFLFQGAAYEGLTCNVLEWLASNGAGHIVESDGTVSINNLRSKAALTLARSWVGTISPKEVTIYQEEESRNAWQEGHAAFLRNWPYVYALSNAETSAVKGRFAVTYLPRGDGPNASQAATLGGWQLMLSAYSKNKDAAARLIKYMVSYDTQKEYAIFRSISVS